MPNFSAEHNDEVESAILEVVDDELRPKTVYPASLIKRRRATQAEMEQRAEFLIGYAEQHGPITVRGLYYQAEVAGIPGIDKDDKGYAKVQYQVLDLRRNKRLAYTHIADATRWMRRPRAWSSIEDALTATAQLYRKRLWDNLPDEVEIWCEKDALAGVIYPVTSKYDVPLMVTRGLWSETFCFEAVENYDEDKTTYVYYLGDFDRAGQDAARALQEKLARFADERGVEVEFETIAITLDQIREFNLPTRKPKRGSAADLKWPHDFACELDALPPDDMRSLVEAVINLHLTPHQLEVLKIAEQSEREILTRLVGGLT